MTTQDEIPDLDTMERGLVVIGTLGAFLTAYAGARGAAKIAGDVYDRADEVANAVTTPGRTVLEILGYGRKGGIL